MKELTAIKLSSAVGAIAGTSTLLAYFLAVWLVLGALHTIATDVDSLSQSLAFFLIGACGKPLSNFAASSAYRWTIRKLS